jgi:hypothetical protein
MNRILQLVPLAAALVVLGWAGRFYRSQKNIARVPPAWPALEPRAAAWTAENFKAIKETAGDHLNFATGLVLDPGAAAVARLAIHYRSSDDCLYAELAGRQLSLVGARGGLHRTLASAKLPAPPAPGVEHAWELRRRGEQVAVIFDGQVLAVGFAESFSGGQAAVGQSGPGLQFRLPRLVETETVLFLDDFMRPAEAPSAWRAVAGKWQNKGIRNPSMSANAFRFSAAGRPALAVTGQHTWDQYSFAASVCGAPGGQVGLVFSYRDERNYCLFRWGAREKPLESAAGLAELVRVSGGVETILQRALIGYIPEQWYRVDVTLGWGWTELAIDGQRLLAAADAALSGGLVGLWANAEAETLFDDVRVLETADFQERFYGPASTWSSWDFLDGDWQLADGVAAQGLQFSGPASGALAVFGSARWTNCAVRAEILPQAGKCGLVYHYRDAANYSCLSYDCDAGRIELVGVRNGAARSLGAAETRLEPGMHRFEVRLDRGLVRATVDGASELLAWQTDQEQGGLGLPGSGRAGLAVWGGKGLARSLGVQLLAEIEPLPVINPIFAADAEMTPWSSWQGDWATDGAARGREAGAIRWHRARFSGDVTMLTEVAGVPKDEKEPAELALSVAKSGESSGNGYILKLSRPGAAKTGASLVLVREGQKVAEAAAGGGGRIWTVALRKAGPFVVGYLNSRESLVWRDPEPLDGQKVAWYSRGFTVEEDGARVYSGAVQNETFDRAPAEWRVADGIWEISNRWQCDPRWSFFSGRAASRQKKLAALWSKRELGDDAVVEFFAGIKMDSSRGGQYQYARDINCTLSADGKDLASGYSFLFGGFDDDHSAILRKGVEVARTPSGQGVIPRQGAIHHRWFYIRAERRGPHLRFTVDGGRLVDLSYTDPEPLAGRRLAIWTWDDGIMVSRVRVSGLGGEFLEPLDFVPTLKCASPYPEP